MLHRLSAEAQQDLIEIWSHIAGDSVELADRIEREFLELFASLGKLPRQGHRRPDFTKRPVLFISLHSFLIVYGPESRPIQIHAVLRGSRDIRRALKGRI